MGCTIHGHKTFLVVCNIALLFTGLSILILGMKMKGALTSLRLDKFPALLQTAKAMIASGFFIAITGGTGFSAACYDMMWLVYVHLGGLAVIITMEFALGVTLIVVKNTIENFMASEDCGKLCSLTLQTVVLDLAIPSAGLMMTIIIIQALMIYSAMQLYYYLKDRLKDISAPTGPTVIVQNMQMQNVGPQPPEPMYPPPQPSSNAGSSPYRLGFSPMQPGYDPAHQQPYTASPTHQVSFSDDQYVDPPPYAEVGSQTALFPGQDRAIMQVVPPQVVPRSAEVQTVPAVRLPDLSKSY